ncbi:MAG: hypothetical protein A2252_09115 [Elusimicrobia bacterium RIFOXYA2_FULL_39_19]|nr:MAG: hypothetical protein A2252_09115 [Elusimicrobia bacterium RIFOXYA2_FULL_39_19]
MLFMSGWFFMGISIGFFIIQWLVLRSVPKYLLRAFAYFPLLGFLANLAASGSISIFTGVASFVGICNMISSIGVSFWLIGYARFHGVKLVWKRYAILLKYPDFVEENPADHWLF